MSTDLIEHLEQNLDLMRDMITRLGYDMTEARQAKIAGYKQAIIDVEAFLSKQTPEADLYKAALLAAAEWVFDERAAAGEDKDTFVVEQAASFFQQALQNFTVSGQQAIIALEVYLKNVQANTKKP